MTAPPNADSVGRYWDRATGLERKRILDWIVEGCLIHGASESTSYLVAAEFAKGLDAPPNGSYEAGDAGQPGRT